MPRFCVNKNAQPNGDHEVHVEGAGACMPDLANQVDLGIHPSCFSAVLKAKEIYPRSNGCAFCCTACHTG